MEFVFIRVFAESQRTCRVEHHGLENGRLDCSDGRSTQLSLKGSFSEVREDREKWRCKSDLVFCFFFLFLFFVLLFFAVFESGGSVNLDMHMAIGGKARVRRKKNPDEKRFDDASASFHLDNGLDRTFNRLTYLSFASAPEPLSSPRFLFPLTSH